MSGFPATLLVYSIRRTPDEREVPPTKRPRISGSSSPGTPGVGHIFGVIYRHEWSTLT